MSTTNLTPGWYPDPSGTPRKKYFDGESWIDAFATPPTDIPARKSPSINWNWGVMVLGVIGLVMSMQSTSLLNGTGTIWFGVVLVAVAVATAFFMGADSIVKTVAALMLAVALSAALYMEHQMDVQRDKVTHVFDTAYRS